MEGIPSSYTIRDHRQSYPRFSNIVLGWSGQKLMDEYRRLEDTLRDQTRVGRIQSKLFNEDFSRRKNYSHGKASEPEKRAGELSFCGGVSGSPRP